MKKSIGAAVCVFVAGGVAAAGVPNKAALDGFDRTGERVSCVSARSADITPIDETTVLVRSGGDYYVNALQGKCSRIADNFTRVEMRLFSNQLCSGEIVKVVHQANGTFLSSCSLGDFEKLTKKAPQAAPAEQP